VRHHCRPDTVAGGVLEWIINAAVVRRRGDRGLVALLVIEV
jgi:hypothetical protein